MPDPANVLVVVLDDVGVEQVGAYGAAGAPPTPVIDALAERGLRFDRAWATPVCSPSRAAILTGRFPEKNHIGAVLKPRMRGELPLSEMLIPEVLDSSGTNWSSAAVGKWHLSTANSPSGAEHPKLQGFDFFAGSLNNPGLVDQLPEGERDYYNWERVGPNGHLALEHGFSTTVITDDAIGAIRDLKEPFFAYVAYHAGHLPLSVPPRELTGNLRVDNTKPSLFAANVAAADHEIGRLLESLGPRLDRTLVVVLGDNGTASGSRGADDEGSGDKGTFLEGGVRVPLVMAGPPVRSHGGHTGALVSITDLLPTFADLAGAPTRGLDLDGTSLVPILADSGARVRDVVYTERRHPADGPPWTEVERAARDEMMKVIAGGQGIEIFRFDTRNHDIPVAYAELNAQERARVGVLIAEIERHGAPLPGYR